MSTAPWSDAAPAALRGSLFHDVAVAIVPATGDPIDLDVDDRAEVTFDEGWAPHVQAQVRCKVPQDQATLDAIDPRRGARLVLAAGYVYPGGARDVHQLADLCLRSRPVDRPDNTLDLSAGSDEYRVQDLTPLGASRVHAATMTVRASIVDLLQFAGITDVDLTATDTATLGEIHTVSTGADLWGEIVDRADRINAWVYHDGAGWHVTDRPTLAGRTVHTMEVGPAGNIETSRADLDVADWANAVLLEYDADTFVYAQATTGPFAVGTVPVKVAKFRRTTAGPIDARQAAAATVLRRTLSRGRGFTLEGPSAYWLRPGHTITAQLPTGPPERHLVSRVTFDLPAGRMTVRTRVPDNDTTITTGA